MTKNNFKRSFKRILKQAGLTEIRFHDLRDTLALQAGISPKTIQAVLGHSNVSTTMNTYGHVTPEMQKQAAEIIRAFCRDSKRSPSTPTDMYDFPSLLTRVFIFSGSFIQIEGLLPFTCQFSRRC